MTDLDTMFDLSKTPDYQCITARTAEEFRDAIDEIGAGLLSAGCGPDEVTVVWWPNAPTVRKQFVVKGVVRYEVYLKASGGD